MVRRRLLALHRMSKQSRSLYLAALILPMMRQKEIQTALRVFDELDLKDDVLEDKVFKQQKEMVGEKEKQRWKEQISWNTNETMNKTKTDQEKKRRYCRMSRCSPCCPCCSECKHN